MLEKHHTSIWNFLAISLFIGSFLICVKKPHFYSDKIDAPKDVEISQNDTLTTIWKRGEFASTTSVKEKRSYSNIDKYCHKSPDWTTIKWKKNHDPES